MIIELSSEFLVRVFLFFATIYLNTNKSQNNNSASLKKIFKKVRINEKNGDII